MRAQTRNRAFCLTINNFSEIEKQYIKDEIEMNCDIAIAEIEHDGSNFDELEEQGIYTPDTDMTPHIQAYLHYPNAKRIDYVKRRFPRAHIEVAKGDWRMNFIYCSKENKIFAIKGHTVEEAKTSKDKSKLIEIISDAKTMSINDFEQRHPEEWYKHRDRVLRTMIDSAALKSLPWNGSLHSKNIWIFGKPGVGKSKWASQLFNIEFVFRKNFNKWWDGYNLLKTKCVILEDYPSLPAGNSLCQHLKIWGDRYQFTGECKGSHIYVDPGRFFLIITSNYSIENCFSNQDDIEAIKRRFKVIEMNENNAAIISRLTLDESVLSK